MKTVGKISYNPKQRVHKKCDVFKGKYENFSVAVKIKNYISKEVQVHKSIGHPNVVRTFWSEIDQNDHYIAEELCKMNYEHFAKKQKTFSKKLKGLSVIKMCHQIAAGLSYLHEKEVVHTILHPRNILIAQDGRAKIGDFCTERTFWIKEYTAPELTSSQPLSPKIDEKANVFSLGCLLHFGLTSGDHPFSHVFRNPNAAITQDDKPMIGSLGGMKHRWQAELAKQLIKNTVAFDPYQRPSCKNILSHPLFWKPHKVFNFFQSCFKYLNHLPSTEKSKLNEDFEKVSSSIVGNWKEAIQEEMEIKETDYETKKVMSLLFFIQTHLTFYEDDYSKLSNPGRHLDFWLEKFPRLFPHCYHFFSAKKRNENFSDFYPINAFQRPSYFSNQIDDYDDELMGCDRATKELLIDSKLVTVTEKVLGSGKSFIYAGKLRQDGREIDVAIKKIELKSATLGVRISWSELNNLKKVQSENVVKFLAHFQDRDFHYLVLEPAICNLDEFLMNDSEDINNLWSEISIKKISLDTTRGLCFMHKKEIFHFDLKPKNILIVVRDQNEVKAVIGDFGNSKENLKISTSVTITPSQWGTQGWMAPEVIKMIHLNSRPLRSETKPIHHAQSKADVFVLGLIIYYGYNGMNHLYGEPKIRDSNIRTGRRDYSNRKSDDMLLLELVKNMTANNPEKRPHALDVFNHPSLWNQDQTMKFFTEAESKEPKTEQYFKMYIEDWTEKIDQVMLGELKYWSAKNGKHFVGSSLKNMVGAICSMNTFFNTDFFSKSRDIIASHDTTHLIDYWIKAMPELLWIVFFAYKKAINSPEFPSAKFKFTTPRRLPQTKVISEKQKLIKKRRESTYQSAVENNDLGESSNR